MKASLVFKICIFGFIASTVLGMFFLINNDSARLSASAGIAQEWAAGIFLVLALVFFAVGYTFQNRK